MRVVRGPGGRREPELTLAEPVAAIIDEVRRRGDDAVLDFTERFDHAELGPGQLRVDANELEASVGVLEPDVLAGLRTAIANVKAVARAQVRDETLTVELPEGHTVDVVEHPVRRAAVYVPGGRAPYPSTVVMGAVTARVAGVEQVVVCAPPGPGGRAHPVILAACVLCQVTEVYRMGGAQAIAALAYGTESVRPVDVIVGPGSPYVQEAKRQVVGRVGIDGIAGPSELVVIAAAGADPELIALDLLAQAEHGPDSPVWCISPDAGLLDAVAAALEGGPDGEARLVQARDVAEALRSAEEIAPEHLELVGDEAEALADRVRNAGCLFVGPGGATAFGDYVAGSNHVLPTGGAARFQSALSPATFRRRLSRVSLPPEAAARLAPHGAALARAEGFPLHAESMERRA
ncbi:MAG TPA: histidinol dehydrogenase [Thermoleophilaceae bacterium]|nr:histidinol dehydrogenase [Thermoleophilaceae bacterium]